MCAYVRPYYSVTHSEVICNKSCTVNVFVLAFFSACAGQFLPALQSTVLKQLTQAQTQANAHAMMNTPNRVDGQGQRLNGSSSGRKQRPPPASPPDERIKSESTEVEELSMSLSVSEGDDYSDSVSSIGGDHFFDQTISVSLNNSFSENSGGGKRSNGSSRNKRFMMLAGTGGGPVSGGTRGGGSSRHLMLNKYKAEIYMLQNQLEEAQAVDKIMLQDRIHEYQ